ncbi:MAG: hypothetical protein AAGI01_17950 [Myxococcota bacterium]
MSDDLHDIAAALTHRLTTLPELPMRAAVAGDALTTMPPEHTVWWLDRLVRQALWGSQESVDAVMAIALWLISTSAADNYSTLQRLFETAYHEGREAVLFLLRTPPPKRALGAGARLPEVRLPISREVTLGERRSFARSSRRDLLERLIMDPSELVIAMLLNNPHLRLSDVLTIASRRPTRPELLLEVARHARWVRELEVREALVMNPFISTGVALKYVPTLNIRMLRRIQDMGDLHHGVSRFAAMLVYLREERTAPLRI